MENASAMPPPEAVFPAVETPSSPEGTGKPSTRKPSGAELLRGLVGECLAALLPHASDIAAGRGDDKSVHQLRVGLRRLRTVLRELGGLAEGVDPYWEPALATTFGALGRWRDQGQLSDRLLPELAQQGGPLVRLAPAAEGPSAQPPEVVRSPAFQQALSGLLGFAQGAGGDAGLAPRPARALLRQRLARLHKKVRRAAADFEQLPAEQQHRVRKQLKRLRYLGEFTGPLFDGKRARRYLRGLKPAQDALGRQNDEAVALDTLRALAIEQPQAWFGVGWLSARRGMLAREGRKSLRRATAHRPFWA